MQRRVDQPYVREGQPDRLDRDQSKEQNGGWGRQEDTACWPLGWTEEPVWAAGSQLLEFSSCRLGQGLQSEIPAGLFSSPLAHPVLSVLVLSLVGRKPALVGPWLRERPGFQLFLCIHPTLGASGMPRPPIPRPFFFIITTRSLLIAHLNILVCSTVTVRIILNIYSLGRVPKVLLRLSGTVGVCTG